MKKLTITISTENDAFTDDPRGELAGILEVLTKRLRYSGEEDNVFILRDINGNRVGECVLQ
jgi:hypothetical protein